MSKVLLVDVARCNGCHNCQIACKDEHVEKDWSPYAKPQPLTGQFWIKVNEKERGTIPKVMVSYVPTLCAHCGDAPCMKVCPTDAIYRRDDGIVIIDPVKCNGCQECLYACPYGAIYFNDDLGIAQKCTMCAHLLDGGWKEPRCVDACPTGALIFGDEEDAKIKEMIGRSSAVIIKLKESIEIDDSSQLKPRVLYLNVDVLRPFVAGAVYDPEADEVLQGVRVTLVDEATGESRETTTDEFGDFWFRNLTRGASYTVRLEKDGYREIALGGVRSDMDVNLGDIKMYRVQSITA